jgi:CheY-like chemotaxis protein
MTGRVLVVDDDPVQRLVASRMLVAHGVDALAAADGFDALDVLLAVRIDLVLVDCHLPLMSGFDLARAIRARHSGATPATVPVVAVTGSAVGADAERFTAAGMDGAVAKPLRRVDVASLLARWLPQAVGAG